MNKIWDLECFGDNLAVLDDDGNSVTYKQLDVLGKELAQTVGNRCLAFIMASNTIGSLVGYIGFTNNGIVPVMLSAMLDEGSFLLLLQRYLPDAIWASQENAERILGLCSDYYKSYNCFGFVLLKRQQTEVLKMYDSLALLLTTSGSTGSPKFVRQSYTNIMDNARSIAEYLEIVETERPITTLPMNYTYGLSIINSHLLVGATILMTDKGLMQKEFWGFFKNGEATSFGGVPYTYEMLDKLRFYRMDLPSLRYMTQAGGKLSVQLHEKFARYAEENEKKFVVMYGQCEATARMGYLPANMALEKIGSMGIAIPGGAFYLINNDGKIIDKSGEIGELIYEGNNVTLGYAECPEDLEKGDERAGRLETGDMAEFDEDGYFYIVGRKKRFLKIYGNRVNLDEIERMIASEFGVEVASAGVDDHMYIFVLDDTYSGQVKDFVVRKTKLNPAAFKVIAISSIPRNDSGKIQYKELSRYYDI